MAIINLLMGNLFNIAMFAISILIFLVFNERFKYQTDFLFWTSLGLISFLSPLAYVQGFLVAQRLIQVASAGMLLLSLSHMRKNLEKGGQKINR